MLTHPPGFLASVRQITEQAGVLLIADEVATGFCKTGKLFACMHENVSPDLMCLGKGLSGGYLPVAATMTTRKIFDAFLPEGNTFYPGHTFTGNALGCAAAAFACRRRARAFLDQLKQDLLASVAYAALSKVDDPRVPARPVNVSRSDLVEELGVPGVELRLGSLGSLEARREYLEELKSHLRSREAELSGDVHERIELNPLRAFDSDHEGTKAVMDDAPQLLDHLDAQRKRSPQPPRDVQPGRVIAPELVPDTDDLQDLLSSSFRKWVAHEMHGS